MKESNAVEKALKDNYIVFITDHDLSCFVKNGEVVNFDKSHNSEMYNLLSEIKRAEATYEEYCRVCPAGGKKYRGSHYCAIGKMEQQVIDYLKRLYL